MDRGHRGCLRGFRLLVPGVQDEYLRTCPEFDV
jgi:hypothetical protein